MSADEPLVATASQTVGPFFHFALTASPNGRLVDRLQGGDPLRLVVGVRDGNGDPVDDAMVELSLAGAFGRMATDENGTCTFDIARPGSIAGGRTSERTPFVTVCVFARGLLRHLHTRIYFAGEASLEDDSVLALVPEPRRHTLLARPDAGAPGVWRFDVHLQGPSETVFFDA